MRTSEALCLPVLLVLCGLSSTELFAAAKPNEKAGVEFFEKKIRPVLVRHCYECHSAKSKIVQANLFLDTRDGLRRGGDSGAAVVPGDAAGSPLLEALRYETVEMPPKGKLSDEIIADFAAWIEMGAPDPRDAKAPVVKGIDLAAGRQFWSFQPPQLKPPGSLKDSSWPRTEIDRYVLARLEAEGLKPAADADRAMLLRRLTFDVTGLPPTPDELAAFAADRSPQAVEKVVDRLLASPQFGERWGRHWLDVVRYAESCGKERNVPYRLAWRYRDYVIDAFNADLPYDEFLREQLAGDLLPAASTAASTTQRNRRLIATGFLTIGPKSLTERIPEQYLLDVADEQLDTTCRAMLASTVGCARCHDHKFDPIPTTDYYGLIGIFHSTENLAGVLPLVRVFTYPQAATLGDAALPEILKLQKRIGELEREITLLNNDIRDANKAKNPTKRAEVQKKLDATTATLTAARTEAETDDPKTGPRFAMAVRDREKPEDYAVRIRGELAEVGPIAPRGFMSVLADEHTPKIDPSHSGRLELARWISDRRNPLTARVMVNRLWHHLFGKGIVESTDNFGALGDRPTHPELLDYLAIRFMDEGWSVKRALREMLLSRAYQMSSRSEPTALARDPDNRLLWRYTPQRLEAEAVRDAMLAVAGRLDLARPRGSSTLTLNNLELGSSARILAADETPRHRSVYLPLLRGNVPEFLTLFDMADPSLVSGKRETTIVATQALYLMNSPFVAEQARNFAERLLKPSELNDSERLDWAYRLALSRLPHDSERRQVLDYIKQTQATISGNAEQKSREAWIGVCQALLGSGEFRYVH